MRRERQFLCTSYNSLTLLVLTLFSVAWWVSAKTGPSHGKVVVCYISTWAVYRPGHGAYSIDNFDPKLCSHVVYAFAGLDITQSAIKSLDPWQDLKEEYGKGGYERLTNLKHTHPHLKVSLAIGGWNEGSKNYSILVSDPFQRNKFVKHVSNFIRKYNFDGLDLDWEYPTQRGGDRRDRENFVLLTKELREEFDNHNLLLSSAIGAAKNVIDEAYDVRQISRYLDFLHIMCYDYHGSWDKQIGYNAPLTAPKGDVLSVEFTIDYLLKLGAPPEKLVLGLPFYGRTFKTNSEGNIGDSTDGTGFQGPFTREDGFLGYNEICNILSNKTSGWTIIWNEYTSQALARSDRNVDGLVQVVTFDNSRSIANKVKFAMMKNLAGVMIWSVDTDDFLGECIQDTDTYTDYSLLTNRLQLLIPKRINSNYPLLHTINEAMILTLDIIDNEPSVQDNEIPHGTTEDHKFKSSASTLTSAQNLLLALLNICLYVIHLKF